LNVGDEKSKSISMEADTPCTPALDHDLSADVIVFGPRIAGLSTAYELSLKGRDAIVLDRGAICRGITARTTSHLALYFFDDSYAEAIKLPGLGQAKTLRENQSAAIQRTLSPFFACATGFSGSHFEEAGTSFQSETPRDAGAGGLAIVTRCRV
jgi:glycine/D-amino acid oxidase-like deaminating enzyme